MVTEVSIKDQLVKLTELQKIDEEIFGLNNDLVEKPAIIEDLKQQFEGSKARLNELEENLKAVAVARKAKELELQQKEEAIQKSNAQLSEIKTNKEYTAKLKEIENIKADKSIIEEAILVSYDDADAINLDIEKEKSNVAEREKEFQTRKAEVEDEMKVIKDRMAVLQGQRNQITPNVDAKTLAVYDRVLSKKNGVAIAPISNGICGGCFINVLQQQINLIKMSTEIVQCEKCSRIMYIEEDL